MGFPSIPQWPTGWLPFANVHIDDGEDENEDADGENERPKNTEKFNIRKSFKWDNAQLGEHMKGGRGKYMSY